MWDLINVNKSWPSPVGSGTGTISLPHLITAVSSLGTTVPLTSIAFELYKQNKGKILSKFIVQRRAVYYKSKQIHYQKQTVLYTMQRKNSASAERNNND